MEKHSDKLRSKIGYGTADLYGGGAFLIVSILYLYFLTDVVGMNPLFAGSIPFIGKAWDAISDPLMGRIVDRTRSRYGAKRLYLLFGSFIAGITFFLLWLSIGGGEWVQYLYYLFTFMLFSTGFTIVMVPYNALLPDMIRDYHLRGQYTAIRMIFSALSAILGGLLPDMIVNRIDGGATGFAVMGGVFGLIFLFAILTTFKTTWERPESNVKNAPEKWSSNLTVFKNRAFRYYLGIFLFGQGSMDFIMALVMYFLTYVLFQSGEYVLVMAGVLSSQLLAMFLYQALLKNHSKKLPAWIGFPIQAAASFGMLFFAYEGAPILPIFILSFMIGFGTAAGTVTSFSILADMADVDELITTKRRAGMYSGMATFARKVANGIALGLIGLVLFLIGYDGSLEFQDVLAREGIKYMFILMPVVFIVFTLYFVKKYPVTQDGFEVLQKAIIDFRSGRDSLSEEEKKKCEAMTGYPYDELWSETNAEL
ncbi:MAG: MFS transporter [Candidatus Izemoplasmataceae bacterium]